MLEENQKDQPLASHGKEKKLSPDVVYDRKALQQQLIFSADQKVEDQGSDEALDRENLKIQLLGGGFLDLGQLNVVCQELQEYAPRFTNDFYVQIFRLNKWKFDEEKKISQKPNKVGKWTKEIIYSRFGKEVLPVLEELNPYVRIGLRRHKHHQYLNEEGIAKLHQYINESIVIMKQCDDWYSFRVKLFEIHGVSYQLDIYEERKRK